MAEKGELHHSPFTQKQAKASWVILVQQAATEPLVR